MKKRLTLLCLICLHAVFGQADTSSFTLVSSNFPRFLESLNDTDIQIASDTLLTEIDSLNGRVLGRYYFKTVSDPIHYVDQNQKNMNAYFWIYSGATRSGSNELLIDFRIGTFKKFRENLFRRKRILKYTEYNGLSYLSLLYKYDPQYNGWIFQGRVRG